MHEVHKTWIHRLCPWGRGLMLLAAIWGVEASVYAQISEAPLPTTDKAELHWTQHMGGAEVDLSHALERFDALSHIRT